MARVSVIGKKGEYVNLVLTRKEARALANAAGVTLDHTDATLTALPKGGDRAAAGRAYDALWKGWVRALHRSRGEE
jgi:hypothetical protein